MTEDELSLEPPRRPNYLEKLRASKLKYPFVMLASNSLFLPMIYFQICLGLLILPLSIVFFLWLMRIENIWRQLAIGAVTFCIAAAFAGAAYYPIFDSLEQRYGESPNGVLFDGSVTPFRGDDNTLFNYSISIDTTIINITETESDIEVKVYIIENYPVLWQYDNITMADHFETVVDNETISITYYYETNIDGTINGFEFFATIDGMVYRAQAIINGDTILIQGPIHENGFILFGYLTLVFFFQIISNGVFGFIILLLIMRFMRRSREAKNKMMKNYQHVQREKEAEAKKTREFSRKLPGVAVGEGSEDVFVCSECGADVPASAKFCPNCGEPFEED